MTPWGAHAPKGSGRLIAFEETDMQDSEQCESALLSEEQRIAANRAAIFDVLRAEGVLRAVASYCGSGDSGGPEGVRFELPDGRTLDEVPEVPQYREASHWSDGAWHSRMALEERELEDAIADLAMEVVERHYGGWEDGDGASGEVTFDATDGSVLIGHRAYFTDSDYSEVRL